AGRHRMNPGNLNRWKFVDPFPSAKGVLLSDLLESYVTKYGVLVDKTEFKATSLKPASYLLTLSKDYYYDGEQRELRDDECLVVPPNSFVIASTAERVVLPHYIVGRFGLRVDYVYRGLLVGAGPQVDPGFEGYLACP